MRKRALGSSSTTQRETAPLRAMMDGIRVLLTWSDWGSASDNGFGRFSANVSGEIWRASSSSSPEAEADWTAKFCLTSVTPALSDSSGDRGASPPAPRRGWASAAGDKRAGVLPPWCAEDLTEPFDIVASHSLNPTATSRSQLWVTPGVETHSAGSSRRGRPAGLSVNPFISVGHRFIWVLGRRRQETSEAGISSPSAWELSDPCFDSCCREDVEAGSSVEGLLSIGCGDVWMANLLWVLDKGCDFFCWADSLSTTAKLVWGVVSDDMHGDGPPGDTVWADSVPSTDGSSWLQGPDGWTAIC